MADVATRARTNKTRVGTNRFQTIGRPLTDTFDMTGGRSDVWGVP